MQLNTWRRALPYPFPTPGAQRGQILRAQHWLVPVLPSAAALLRAPVIRSIPAPLPASLARAWPSCHPGRGAIGANEFGLGQPPLSLRHFYFFWSLAAQGACCSSNINNINKL